VPNNVTRWWVPISAMKLFGADGEDDPDPDSQADDDDDASDDDDDSGDGPTTYDQAYVDKLRKEAAGRRVSAKTESERADAAEAALAKLKEAEMNDIEKATTAAEKAVKTATDAEARATAAEAALKQTNIRQAVTLAAIEQNFQDPTDALTMISQDDLVDDEGEISAKAVKASLTKLAKAKPYLLGTKKRTSGDGGPKGNPADEDSYEKKREAYLKEMTTTGGRVPAA
jgi:hypothetical protein